MFRDRSSNTNTRFYFFQDLTAAARKGSLPILKTAPVEISTIRKEKQAYSRVTRMLKKKAMGSRERDPRTHSLHGIEHQGN